MAIVMPEGTLTVVVALRVLSAGTRNPSEVTAFSQSRRLTEALSSAVILPEVSTTGFSRSSCTPYFLYSMVVESFSLFG